MKKIVSPLVLAILLAWTWHTIHTPAAIGFETHSGIQLKLMELIQATLQERKPDFKDLEVTRIWTSALGDNKVQATFSYRFTEPGADGGTAQKTIQGEAVLHREPTEDPTIDKWVLQSVKTQLESLNFSEGSEILPEAEGSISTPDPTAVPTPDKGTPAETEKPQETESH